MHHVKATANVSEPACRNVEHWSNSSWSVNCLEGSTDWFDLTDRLVQIYNVGS